MKLKHYANLGVGDTLLNEEAWGSLRNNKKQQSFYLPESKEDYNLLCNSDSSLILAADKIGEVFEQYKIKSVFSPGCGRAVLEFHLKQLKPHIHFVCADNSKMTVDRLKQVIPQCNPEDFDMLGGYWPTDHDLVLLNRIDAELSDIELQDMFRAIFCSRVKYIMVILCEDVDFKLACTQYLVRVASFFRQTPLTYTGVLRSVKDFDMYQPWFKLLQSDKINENPVLVLVRRDEDEI